jgi:hypothetical protein
MTMTLPSLLPVAYLLLTFLLRLGSEILLLNLEASHYAGFGFLRLAGLVLVPVFVFHASRQRKLDGQIVTTTAALQIVIVLGFLHAAELATVIVLFIALLFGVGISS